ncbi:MAG: urate hydroxylase PuuD, partial [Burkholderiales bacterium]|nr:urate hydroxylase PuuD [Burkholderiales bacterium]
LYDTICRVFGQKKNGDAIVGLLVLVLVCIASWLACHWFAGRAAFLLVGAMMATAMSANVFFWIIPGQRTVVAQIKAGQPVDPIHGKRGTQRSVHNTYFTLPVLFAMLSGHYSFTWNHPQNWLVLILMMFAGAAIRQFFVTRHGYKLGRNGNPLPYALVGMAVIVGVIVWLRPAPVVASTTSSIASSASQSSAAGLIGYEKLHAVLEQRCYMCHGAQVQMKNIRLDSPALVRQNAQNIYQMVVVQKLMPMNNATGMTDEERALVGRWFEAGAPVQ